MVIYNCEICGAKFKMLSSFTQHTMSDFACEKVLHKKYECNKCNKKFTNNKNMKIHMKTKCNILIINELEEVKNKLKEIEKIKEELNKVKMQTQRKPGRPKKITNNTTNNMNSNNTTNITNQTINNNKFMIVNFGKEDIDRLTLHDKREILNSSYSAILKCAMKINFNPEIPEQNNIFITNPKSDYAYKYDNGKFVAIKTNDLLDELIHHRMNDVRELVDQNDTLKIGNNKIERVNDLLNNIDEEKLDNINNLKKDLKLTLFNENDIAIDNKKKIENDKKN